MSAVQRPFQFQVSESGRNMNNKQINQKFPTGNKILPSGVGLLANRRVDLGTWPPLTTNVVNGEFCSLSWEREKMNARGNISCGKGDGRDKNVATYSTTQEKVTTTARDPKRVAHYRNHVARRRKNCKFTGLRLSRDRNWSFVIWAKLSPRQQLFP